MSINNVNAVSDGLKYVNGLEVCPEQTNIVQDVKDSIFNPITLAFGGLEVSSHMNNAIGIGPLGLIKNKVSYEDGVFTITDKATNKANTVVSAIDTSKNIGNQWNSTLQNIYKKADLDGITKSAFESATPNARKAAVETAKELILKNGDEAAKQLIKNGTDDAIIKAASNLGDDAIVKIKDAAFKSAKGAVSNVANEAVTAKKGLSDLAKEAVSGSKYVDDTAQAVAEKAVKKQGLFSKIGNLFKGAKKWVSSKASSLVGTIAKTPVGTAVKKFFTDGAGKGIAKVAGKVGKLFKGTGAAGMMIFDGVIKVFTEVIPAFQQGGFKSGMKQIGKSATTVLAGGLGWAGGTAAATALGAAIGSVFPGVGTVIGGAIGTFIGGMLGSTLATGVASKVVGKSEVEKIQEEQINQQAQMVAQDTASMNELNALVAQQVQTDIANGNVTKDTEKMAEYLNNGSYNVSFTGVNQVNYTTPTTTSTATNTNYWNQIAQSIQSGDTSIYNISDDQLNALFTQIPTSYGATNSQVVEDDGKVNYFAVG